MVKSYKAFHLFLFRVSAVATAMLACNSTTAQGPKSRYYLTDGGFLALQVIQSGAITSSWNTALKLYPLAVSNTVKAYNTGDAGSAPSFTSPGREYTLSGIPTGVTYPWQPGPTGQLLDGGTDAVVSNFAAEWSGQNGIWRYDLEWKNPVRMFTTPVPTVGITYDRSAGTIWISQDGGNIQQITSSGNVISQFNPGIGRWGALAWEPETDTLWAHRNSSPVLRQWTKTGVLLQEVVIAGLSNNIWGGEFAMVPEATTFIGTMTGLLILCCRRGLMGRYMESKWAEYE